ncbi:MAG: hypothetical protein U0271_38205 [Polyangiaceae bacterium]
MFYRALPLTVLVLGCAKPVVAPPIRTDALMTSTPSLEMPRPSPRMTSADVADTLALIDAAKTVLTSLEFRANGLSLAKATPELWLSPVGERVTMDKALAAFLRVDNRYGPVSAILEWSDREVTGDRPGVPGEALIQLGRAKLAQWRSSREVTRSCAINSLVHEMTHTVTRHRPGYQMLFKDRGRSNHRERALVSYTLGSLAQCTYLRSNNIPACVAGWGTNIFNSSCCNESARCDHLE